MKGVRYPFFLVLSFVSFLFCDRNPKTGPTTRPPLLAGVAAAPINPPVGAFIAGDRPNRRFSGIHDSIYAKAAVFSDGDQSIALVTIDCIGLLYPAIQEIRKRASAGIKELELPVSNIIVTSSHTHSGPDVVGIWGAEQTSSGVDSSYMAFLIETAAAQILEASGKLTPVTASYAQGTHGASWVQNICEPEEVDRSLTTMEFKDMNGLTKLTLTNFACHPTFFDGVHDVVSADYLWGFYETMKESRPGEHLFLQGAIGGWVQPDKGDRSFNLGFSRGAGIADQVIEMLGQSQSLDSTTIQIKNKKLNIPVENPGWQQLAQLDVIKRDIGETVESEMIWFRIGPAQFVTHPGETPPSFSFLSKELMTSEPKFILGLGMDALGYILKPAYFEDPDLPHAGYLTSMSPGKKAGIMVAESLKELIPQ